MKNLIYSSSSITIFPKIVRKNKLIDSKDFSCFCFFSIFVLFKNFQIFRFFNFLKNTLKTKVSILIKSIVYPYFETISKENKIPRKKICAYENNLFEAIFFSKKQTLKWKKSCLNSLKGY